MDAGAPRIYFSDYFEIEHAVVENYGALDISLVCDNPAFIDPFLIFANPEYKELHEFIIRYLRLLRDKAIANQGQHLSSGEYKHYYKFPEVKQVWLGYSVDGNAGLGLGPGFAESLYSNLHRIFSDFGKEKITESSHIEKLCLIEDGVGVDKISDFTLNLIKQYILEYTQKFALSHINEKHLKEFSIDKVHFNFQKGLWDRGRFKLPAFLNKGKLDFVLLVPKNLLTRHGTWISKSDFFSGGTDVFSAVENDELRTKLNKFFYDNLLTKINKQKQEVKDESAISKKTALLETVKEYPVVLDYYIKSKEKDSSTALSEHVAIPEEINHYFDAGQIHKSLAQRKFSKITTIDDCLPRIVFFKQVLESNSGGLYISGIKLQEKQLQLMFKLVTYGTLFDYNSEVNNGRGPIDFIVSMGSNDKIGLELKMASNPKLKPNLLNQGRVYQVDSNLKHVVKIIFYFSDEELQRVNTILAQIGKREDQYEIFLIDCRKKASASNVK